MTKTLENLTRWFTFARLFGRLDCRTAAPAWRFNSLRWTETVI